MEPTAAQRAILLIDQLKAAMDRHRWCWACGATDHKCAGWARSIVKRKCCPDCRHDGWPQGLDLDPDPDATLARALQLVVWKSHGPVEFTQADVEELPAVLPPVRMVDVDGLPRFWLEGYPPPGMEADAEIRRMRGE